MADWQEYFDFQKLKSLLTDSAGKADLEVTKTSFIEGFNEVRKVVPGFFTPYKSKTDFALTLAAPILAPFALSALATVLTIGASIAAVVCVGSLLVAGASFAFTKDSEIRDSALNVALISGGMALGCGLFAALGSFVTMVATILTLSYFATRSGVSIAQQQGYLPEESVDEEPAKNCLGC